MKVVITNYNAKSVVFKLDTKDIDTKTEIYKISFKWFNDFEIKELLSHKLMHENPSKFFEMYVPRKTVDKKVFVFEGKAPAYHQYENCERLLADFVNYKIPEKIKEKGEDAIKEFRTWFKENKHLLETGKKELFFDKVRWKFGLDEGIEIVDLDNSGARIEDNFDLETLESSIEELIADAEQFYLESNKNKTIISTFGKNSFIGKQRKSPYSNRTQYSNEEIWAVLEIFDNKYKTPLMDLLQQYYRVKFNPDLEFEGRLLDRLGFRPCGQCFE